MNIMVVGHKRGGTNWLGNMLSVRDDTVYISEPTNSKRHIMDHPSAIPVRLIHNFINWALRDEDFRYIGDHIRTYTQFLADEYSGGEYEHMVVKHPHPELLPWLYRIHEPDKLVFIRRHPLGIFNSYTGMGGWVPMNISLDWHRTLLRPENMGNVELNHVIDPLERLLIMTYGRDVLAEQFVPKMDGYIVEYEDLCLNPKEEYGLLYEYLGWELTEGVREKMQPMLSPDEPEDGARDVKKISEQRAYAWHYELGRGVQARAKAFMDGHDMPYEVAHD